METASLRLKFTPLIKDILPNNSNCCLEIVPEVSCVHNIDKIEWKQNCESIEYTIPMIYKIILKKKRSESVMDISGWSKMYHSCVDLLPPSSLTSFNYASGDVKRIISDTFIISGMKSHYVEGIQSAINIDQMKTQETNEEDENCIFVNRVTAPNVPLDNIEESLEECNVDSKNHEYRNEDKIQDSFLEYENHLKEILEYENSLEYETSLVYETEKKPCSKDIAIEITESLDDIIFIDGLRNKEKSKRQLSVTPICSINTNDNLFAETIDVFSLNSVIYRMFGPEKEHIPKYEAFVKDHVLNKNVVAHKPLALEDVNGLKNSNVTTSFYTTNAEGSKARVAEFVKKMEAEILPLRFMLNDILTKCATLGLLKNKLLASIEFDQANTGRIEEKQSKSNRVVYTVVFDG